MEALTREVIKSLPWESLCKAKSSWSCREAILERARRLEMDDVSYDSVIFVATDGLLI